MSKIHYIKQDRDFTIFTKKIPKGVHRNPSIIAWAKSVDGAVLHLSCHIEVAKELARNLKATALRRGHHSAALVEDGYSHCENCHGSGVYRWGACINGVMTNVGPCFRCESKGYHTVADRRRNWGYDQHRRAV
jgi:hypothetical protein